MESPLSWSETEHLIHDVIVNHYDDCEYFRYGLSLPMKISNALRQAGLLNES